MKTHRAQVIEACEVAARTSGIAIIAHMPRMAEFYKKRANEQLRAARAAADALSVADAKAKLDLVRWAEGWMRGPVVTWPWRDDADEQYRRHCWTMNKDLSMIGYSLRHLIRAHADHPEWRPEWSAEMS